MSSYKFNAKLITDYMSANGLSKSALAKKWHIGAETLNKILAGSTKIWFKVFIKINQLLNVSMNDMIIRNDTD